MFGKVDRASLKSKTAGKASVNKSAAKTAAKSSAGDKVFRIIERSKNGVDTGALMQKTGYDKKKIYNIVFKLKKLNKIKSGGKGSYLSV